MLRCFTYVDGQEFSISEKTNVEKILSMYINVEVLAYIEGKYFGISEKTNFRKNNIIVQVCSARSVINIF